MGCLMSDHKSRADLELKSGCLILTLQTFFSEHQASIWGTAFLVNLYISSLTLLWKSLEEQGSLPTRHSAKAQIAVISSPLDMQQPLAHISSMPFSFFIWNNHISITPSFFLSTGTSREMGRTWEPVIPIWLKVRPLHTCVLDRQHFPHLSECCYENQTSCSGTKSCCWEKNSLLIVSHSLSLLNSSLWWSRKVILYLCMFQEMNCSNPTQESSNIGLSTVCGRSLLHGPY